MNLEMKFPKAFIGVLLISSILFSGWIPGDIRLQTVMQNDGAATSPAKIKGFNTINFTLNYTKLKLTKDQYNSLASNVQYNKDDDKRDGTFRKNDAIVFQFTYASEVYPYPTLRAYPVTFKHQQTSFGNPVNLEYENSKPLPDLSVCNEQVTGDLQITFSDIELLKKQSLRHRIAELLTPTVCPVKYLLKDATETKQFQILEFVVSHKYLTWD